MKAIITAADPRHRNLPFQTITNRDGKTLPLIQLHLEELEAAGIESVGIIHHGLDTNRYAELTATLSSSVTLIPQDTPNGFGDAVMQAKEFVGEDSFVLLVCDHLFISNDPQRNCIKQMLDIYELAGKSVSAVQPTHESQVTRFGVVGADPVGQRAGLYSVKQVKEKPTPTEAELHLRVPGNRSGYYLGFFGIHVLTSDVFSLIEKIRPEKGAYGLSPALNELARRSGLGAYVVDGRRYDLEADYGILQAQLALALSGSKREAVLSDLVRLLAEIR